MLQGGVMTLKVGRVLEPRPSCAQHLLMVETQVGRLAQAGWAHCAKGYQADAAVNTPETSSQRPCCCWLGRPGPAKNRWALRSSSLTTAGRLRPEPQPPPVPLPPLLTRQEPGF